LIAWDIETLDLGGTLAVITAFDGNKAQVFYSFEDFLKWCMQTGEQVFFSHYGGKYDMLYFLSYLVKTKRFFRIININGKIGIIMKNVSIHRTVKFLDSFCLLPGSLGELAESFKTEHRKMEYEDYAEHKDALKMVEYAKNDSIVLWELLDKFKQEVKELENWDIDFFKFFTIASASARIVNFFHNAYSVTKNFFTRTQENFIRTAYYGGRVEIFKFKGEHLNCYDVNSLYPYAMHQFEFPTGRILFTRNTKKIESLFNKYLGVVEVTLRVPETYCPPLPFRTEKPRKLFFPIGKWRAAYCTEELKKYQEAGLIKILKFHKGIFQAGRCRPFVDFVEKYFSLKRNSTGAKKQIVKLILNSSYGRYGMKRERQEILTEEQALKSGHIFDLPVFKDNFYLGKTESYRNRAVNPIIAVFITSYARMALYDILTRVNEKELYYCDTDSIYTTAALPVSQELGKLKLEGTFDNAIFRAPKIYALEAEGRTTIKAKGCGFLKKDKGNDAPQAMKELKDRLTSSIIQGKPFEFEKLRMLGFLESLRRISAQGKEGFVFLEKPIKLISMSYDKRKRLQNDTQPLNISDIRKLKK
jgi:hypothetical protein